MVTSNSEVALSASRGPYAPQTHGVTLDQTFWSLDSQAGRPALLLLLGSLPHDACRDAIKALAARVEAFVSAKADFYALVDMGSAAAGTYIAEPPLPLTLLFSRSDVFRNWDFESRAPVAVAIDRAGRIVTATDSFRASEVERLAGALKLTSLEEPRDDLSPAPVLLIPNVLSAFQCRALIKHFEASASWAGGMAAVGVDGRPIHRVNREKKHRSDFELDARDPFRASILTAILERIAPEMKRALQFDALHTDRILLARYDDSGGFFKRHRDDAGPNVAFRQFALSLNLNDDFEGGHLMFPEFNDRRYRPPPGAGVVFSCSLLHEATRVTQGRRYCILTFLHNAAAQSRWMTANRRASA